MIYVTPALWLSEFSPHVTCSLPSLPSLPFPLLPRHRPGTALILDRAQSIANSQLGFQDPQTLSYSGPILVQMTLANCSVPLAGSRGRAEMEARYRDPMLVARG